MTLKELYQVSPQAFTFIVERDDELNKTSIREYKGSGPDGERKVTRITPASYPMYKQVLEVELEQAPAPFTVADLLKQEICVDVYDNVCESLAIAFDGPLTLTVQGYAKFAGALNLPVDLSDGVAVVDVDGPEGTWQKKLKIAKKLFEAAAGYCTTKEWHEWFILEG